MLRHVLVVAVVLLGSLCCCTSDVMLNQPWEDLLLVGTVDGYLHALDLDGLVLWDFHTGSPLLSSHTHPSVERLIPAVDGSLYILDDSRNRLDRVGVDIQELVQRAPTVTPDHAWTGTKTARMFVLDLVTGDVVRELNSEFHQVDIPTPPNTIMIGRADYIVQGTDRKPGHQQLWNMSFGKFIADDELESGDDHHSITFDVEDGGASIAARDRASGKLLWRVAMDSQPVALYRVLKDEAGEAVVVELTGHKDRKTGYLQQGSRRMGVHVLKHGEQIYAIPDSSYVSPGNQLEAMVPPSHSTAVSTTMNGKIQSFYSVKTRNKRPRLIAPPEEDLSLIEMEDLPYTSVGGFYLILMGTILLGAGIMVGVALVVRFRTKAKMTPPLPQALKMVVTDKVLGYGSCGTVVFEGRLEGRRIAVKRMLKEFYSLAEKESEILLQGGDSHPNVVSYFLHEEDNQFVYLALSYCAMTFAELFQTSEDAKHSAVAGNDNNAGDGAALEHDEIKLARGLALDNSSRVIAELALGFAFLHSLGIVHRDAKPQNMLITTDGHVQISDMGVARRMDTLNHSFSTQSAGTVGYQAPEVLRGERQSSKIDVWGFGCLMYFVLSRGHHPFGPRLNREANILAGKVNVYKIHDPLAVHLVRACIESSPAARLDMSQVPNHPYFWDAHKRLGFLLDVSDLLEALEGNDAATAAFEAGRKKVLGKDGKWQELLHNRDLVGDMGKYRRYRNTLKDLLRLVRNKSHHYRDLSPALQRELGSHPEGYLEYFMRVFPALFLHCYGFVQKGGYFKEAVFQRYF